jgi:protein TonB
MDYSKRQADPRRHVVGLLLVILLHVFIVYLLMTKLAKKEIEVVRVPIETQIIEEVKMPPPAPAVAVPPPPRLEAPPPPFIPPPEIRVETPPVPPPAISAAPAPTPEPVPTAPVAPPAVEPAPAAPAPAPLTAPVTPPEPVNVRTVCTHMPPPEIPGVNISGTIRMTAKITISGGRVTAVEVSNIRGTTDRRAQKALAEAVKSAVRDYSCTGNAYAAQEFVFNIN